MWGSYIDSPGWIKRKTATINPKNIDDKCFQYVVTVALNYEEIKWNSERVSIIKPFTNKWNGITYPSKVTTSKMRNLSTCFFVHLITCLRTRLYTSHFVHLKQLFMHECTLTCTSPCIYYKDEVNERSIPLSIDQEPSLGIQTFFYRERKNTVLLSTQNQTTRQLSVNYVSKQ